MLKDIYERKMLEKLLKKKTFKVDFADFTKYAPTYLATNENQASALENFDVKDKDVLCVTSSGDFVFNALSLGARKVVTFDINKFARYVLDLKVATIKTYPNVKLYAGFWLSNSPYFLSSYPLQYFPSKTYQRKDAHPQWRPSSVRAMIPVFSQVSFSICLIYSLPSLQQPFYKSQTYNQLELDYGS